MEVNIFLDNLKTSIYGKYTKVFDILESSNTKMITDLNDNINLPEGSVYIALKQTAGKGSYGNSWYSNNNLGLWFSVLLYSPYKKDVLSFLPGIALSKYLREKYNIDAHIKWPNDVLVGYKKISGTLIQSIQKDNKFLSIVGIGVNLFHKVEDFESDIKDKATSLYIETNKKVMLEDFYKEFIKYFEDIYLSKDSLVDLFRVYGKMINKDIKAVKDGKSFKVTVLDITEDGYLIVNNDGIEEIWTSRSSLDIDTVY